MAIVVNKPSEFETNATGGIKVSNTSPPWPEFWFCFLSQGQHAGLHHGAMQFRDKYKDFVKAGAAVFGVDATT